MRSHKDIKGLSEIVDAELVSDYLEDEQLLNRCIKRKGNTIPQAASAADQIAAAIFSPVCLEAHTRNWSYDVLEREVRANLVYRAFTRIGDEKVPDAKTLARLGQLNWAEGH